MPNQFRKVNIEITNICNLQCSFCPEVVRTKKMMEPELFRTVIEQVAPLTKVVCLHLMGDPLLHPKLEELIEICDEHQLKIFFVTNGVLLREKEESLLLHPAFRQVNFSLHSFADNFGDKDATEYLGRIFKYTERAFVERPNLFINYRLWNLSDPRGKLTHNRDMLERIEKRFEIKIPSEWNVREQKSFKIKNRLSLHLETEFVWPALNLPELGNVGTCHGLSAHFGILVDGTVVPCCLDKEAAIPLGKVQETPLKEILKSPRARKIQQGFRNYELTEELCKRCQYIERFQEKNRSTSGSEHYQLA